MSGTTKETLPAASLDAVLAEGNFEIVDEQIEKHYPRAWQNIGDRVRGAEIIALKMKRRNFSNLPAILERKSKKRRGYTLCLATTYELAHYASHSWNGTDWVVAFGSVYIFNGCFVATITSDSGQRNISLQHRDFISDSYLVLCVWVKDSDRK